MKHFPRLNRYSFILLCLVLIHIFFRFYNLEKWASFQWDQIDNAWASAKILIFHKFPLIGMEAKRNSGFYIGPLYYYLCAIFYWITGLHPIASPLLAGCTSMFNLLVLYVISKKLFSLPVAVWACGIYIFSSTIIQSERSQWPVNFIPSISLIIFYLLHKIMNGKTIFFLYLSFFIGLFFHLHFTAVFYPILTFAALPFIRFSKVTLKYIFFACMVLCLFFIPQIIHYSQSEHSRDISKYSSYAQSTFHGIHARRILQVAPDAFIKFKTIIEKPYKRIGIVTYLILPLFFVLYLCKRIDRESTTMCYLITLWFAIPWFIFSTYSGELSDYYFSSTLYLAVIILAWLSYELWRKHNSILRGLLVCFWSYYAFFNFQNFLNTNNEQSFSKNMTRAEVVANVNQYIHFTEGDPQSYMFFYQMYKQNKPLPYKL